MKKTKALLLVFTLSTLTGFSQNVGINTDGSAAASTNLLEVKQVSTTNNTVGIYSIHSGAATTGYGLWAEKTGAGTNNYAGYFKASGATNNYGLIVPASGGWVGIGTATPSTLLHVDGGTATTTQTAATVSANSITTGTALSISSSSTAGGASGSSYLLNLSRSGANSNTAHTAYGLYSAVTNTNATSGTNISGYFTASGAPTTSYAGYFKANGTGTNNCAGYFTASGATNNYALIVPASGGWVGIGTTPNYPLDVRGSNSADLIYAANSGTGDVFRGISNGDVQYACFFGNASPTTSGSGYGITTSNAALQGQVSVDTRTYSFGVYGNAGNYYRNGGVLGCNGWSTGWGALGYQTSGGSKYALYYSSNGTYGGGTSGTGRLSSTSSLPAYRFGMGGCADLLGSWVKGDVYGSIVKGGRFSLYVEGKTFTNNLISVLLDKEETNKKVTYTALTEMPTLTTTGKGELKTGECFIAWSSDIKKVAVLDDETIINITPRGNCKGMYISKVTPEGFWVKELMDGNSNVAFNYTATIQKLNAAANFEVPQEITDKTFDKNINDVMFNENDLQGRSKPMYWDGQKLIFDKEPDKSVYGPPSPRKE
ncbi:MAG: hypothetical protein IT239_00350 [Bacteroidia bacterium]|nr:hypothetical protein [Bacteroidia bacterium]